MGESRDERVKPIFGGIAPIGMAQAGLWALLRGVEANVYGVLLAHANAFTGVVAVGTATLAGEAGVNARTVERIIRLFVVAGLLVDTRKGGGRGRASARRIEVDPARVQGIAQALAAARERSGQQRKHRSLATGVSEGEKPRSTNAETPVPEPLNTGQAGPGEHRNTQNTQNTSPPTPLAEPEHSPDRGGRGVSLNGAVAAADRRAAEVADPELARFDKVLLERQATSAKMRGSMIATPIASSVTAECRGLGIRPPSHDGHRPTRGRIPESEQQRTCELLRQVNGLTEVDARDLARIGSTADFQQAIAELARKNGSVRNVGGWLRQCIKERWLDRGEATA